MSIFVVVSTTCYDGALAHARAPSRRACCSLLGARPADAGRGASWREKTGWAARSGASIGVSNRYDELAGGLAGFHVGVRLLDLTDIESTVHRHADLPCCHGIEKILKHGGR